MGSTRIAFFLPSTAAELGLDRAVDTLVAAGFRFGSEVFVAQHDDDGVPFDLKLHRIREPFEQAFRSLRGLGNLVEVSAHTDDFAFECRFGSPHQPPLFSIGISTRTWNCLAPDGRAMAEETLATVGRSAGAAHVLFLDDPADDFLSKIDEIDGEWMIDLALPMGSEYRTATVWTADSAEPPHLRSLSPTGRTIPGYVEYLDAPAGP